jgi:hypothetical protein
LRQRVQCFFPAYQPYWHWLLDEDEDNLPEEAAPTHLRATAQKWGTGGYPDLFLKEILGGSAMCGIHRRGA